MRPETLSNPPSFQNIILFNLCLSCAKGLLQTYGQDLLLNWSNGYRKHAFNAKFGGIRQHISYGRLNWVAFETFSNTPKSKRFKRRIYNCGGV